ncbi:MAG: hypothetical protein RL432_1077 [Bacteroidota bacterium]|jgi:hypothetical protein
MKLHLIDGTFSTEDAKALLNKFIAAKIEFLESKISQSEHEEDIKQRELRIRTLNEHRTSIKRMNEAEIKTLDIDLMVEWDQG